MDKGVITCYKLVRSKKIFHRIISISNINIILILIITNILRTFPDNKKHFNLYNDKIFMNSTRNTEKCLIINTGKDCLKPKFN